MKREMEPERAESKTAKEVAEKMLAEIDAKVAPYNALTERVAREGAVDMSTLKNKADLATRRELVRDMLRMNRELIHFHNSIELKLRDKLKQAGIAKTASDSFMTRFTQVLGKTVSVSGQIYQTDETIGKSLLAITDLLEEEWGKWKAQEGGIVFDDDNATKRFNDLLDATLKAADEQAAAKRELVELKKHK